MIPASFTFHILFLDANHLGSLFPIISKTSRKRSVRIRDKSLKKSQKAVKHKISQLFMVDLMGVEPTTSRMRTERSPTELQAQI